MGVNYRHDPTNANACMEDIQKQSDGMVTDAEELDSQVKSTVAEWEDTSRNAYDAAKRDFDTAKGQLTQKLMTARTTLGQITDQYIEGEKMATSRLGG